METKRSGDDGFVLILSNVHPRLMKNRLSERPLLCLHYELDVMAITIETLLAVFMNINGPLEAGMLQGFAFRKATGQLHLLMRIVPRSSGHLQEKVKNFPGKTKLPSPFGVQVLFETIRCHIQVQFLQLTQHFLCSDASCEARYSMSRSPSL